MAHVLERAVGPWGGVLISVGLFISLSGALLSWLMLSAETLYSAARDGSAPAWLARENAHGAPAASLWLTSGSVQTFLLAAGHALNVALRGEGYARHESGHQRRDAAIAVLALLYALWLVYAGGIKYLLLGSLLYAPGALLYAWARREHGRAVFSPREWVGFGLLVLAAGVAALGLRGGWLSL
jgi:arginine:ornithine antiporter/lysine permease